jgi:L-rhamnose mutarotase
MSTEHPLEPAQTGLTRSAFVLSIRPDRVEEYVQAHAAVWPEMIEAITLAGIRNYSIFIHGSYAFGYFEADDVEAALARLALTGVNQRWQDAMAELLAARVEDAGPAALDVIFHLD